jgi:hypothetical protein
MLNIVTTASPVPETSTSLGRMDGVHQSHDHMVAIGGILFTRMRVTSVETSHTSPFQ